MAKYVVITLSVIIQGVKRLKGEELDDTKLHKKLLLASYRDGAIKPKGSKAKNPIEVIAQYKAEAKKAEKEAADKKEAEAKKAEKEAADKK